MPEEGEDSDDDLMITLDENATAYEPAAPRYTTQSGVIPGVGPPAGAHSFRDHPATKHEAPEVPGLFPSSAPPTYNQGYGVQPNRPAIGGVPRSAIPGLGGGPAQRGWQSANAPNAGERLCAEVLVTVCAALLAGSVEKPMLSGLALGEGT